MKILTLDKPNDAAQPVMVPLYIDEDVAAQPMVQITAPHYFEENRAWVSHVQVSNGYITISKYGSPTVGFHIDDLVKVLYSQFPELHWLPRFEIQPVSQNIRDGEIASVSVKVNSYKDYKLQWQQFDGKEWKDCTDFTADSFQTKAAGKYRVMATNIKGQTASDEFEVKIIGAKR